MTDQYVVIGGGIAGMSAAAHLAEVGASVTVYEQGKLAGETTGKSGGIFAFYGTPTQYRMKRYGMALYNDFIKTGTIGQPYDRLGHLEVATTTGGSQRVGSKIAAYQSAQPLFEYLKNDEIRQRVLCPHLNSSLVEAAVHVPNAGSFDGQALTQEFAARAEQMGATVTTMTSVIDLLTKDGAVIGVKHDNGFALADNVILAAGPWNARLGSLAGIDLPIGHSRAPILVLDPNVEIDYTIPYLNHVESGIYCIGRDDGTILVGCHTDGDADIQLDIETQSDTVQTGLREHMLSVIADLFPAFVDASVIDEWVGIRSVTPDGNPIVGWTDQKGLSVITFSSSGIQLAPAAGKIIARQLVDGDPTDYYDAVSLTRFNGHDDSPHTEAQHQ